MTLAPETLYQSTDLARRHREVVAAAHRPGGAMIRDKDGEALLLTPAFPVQRDQYVLEGLRTAVQILGLLRTSQEQPAILYGAMAWLAMLPRDDQTTFIWEYLTALQAAEGTGIEPIEQLLYEWHQTARAWSDDDLRADLTSDMDEPLDEIQL